MEAHESVKPFFENLVYDTLESFLNVYNFYSNVSIYNSKGELLIDVTNPRLSGGTSKISNELLLDAGASNGIKKSISGGPNGELMSLTLVAQLHGENSSDPSQEPLGYMTVQIPTDSMYHSLKKIRFGELGFVYLTDSDGNIIAHPESAMLFKNILKADGADKFIKTTQTKDGFIKVVVEEPFSDIRKVGQGYSFIALLIAVFAAVSVFLVIVFISKKLTKPISYLTSMAKKISEGNLECKIKTGGDEEVKLLAYVMDDMRQQIKAQKEKSHFIAIGQSTAMVAHDVRKPLTSMKALLTVLPSIKDDPEQVKRMIANVDRSIVQTNTMLNEILDFSRDSTALDLKIKDPQGMITSALSDALRNHSGAAVNIAYDLKHKYCMCVDGPRTIRALMNILDNAMDAMKSIDSGKVFGQISIGSYEVERDGKMFMGITIADDGPGIPADILPKIFNPFFTSGKKGGTGLGLSICRNVVNMHGGKIEAGRCDNGHGTRFTIELPSSNERALINDDDLIHNSKEMEIFRVEEERRVEYGDTSNTAEFMRLHKERGRLSYLLIVDDEPLFRETIRGLLGTLSQVRDHIKVVEADSGEMGLKIFEGRQFDYVIADIDLDPGCMNGYKFAQIVMEKYPESYALIHSNKRKEEMDTKIRKASNKFLGFLPKPMKASELLQFLACKAFEVINLPAPHLEKGGIITSPTLQKEGEGGFKKMLVINDDNDLLVAFRFMLRESNVKILEALNYEAALEHLKNSKVDVVLSDINLGDADRNGYDILKHVREKDCSLPFYMVSGYSRADEEPKAKNLGASGYLQLPLDKNQLIEIVQ